MAASTSNNEQLRQMLQHAVQSLQWTYSIFWQFYPQQGMLLWEDGYYNGSIKTRKTIQPSMDVSAEEVCFQRSQQLRELYDSLSAGESTQAGRRPTAALSPEDLTETEWFYLMCVSFSFPLGVGLPGKTYAKGEHVWLARTNEVDSSEFSRVILAKSARIQTIVCVPVRNGAVELGYTELVEQDFSIVDQVKSIFIGHHLNTAQPPPNPALSEHSASNRTPSSSAGSHFHPPRAITTTSYTLEPPLLAANRAVVDEDDDGDEMDHETEVETDSEAQTTIVSSAQPSELMQLEMPDDMRLGSSEDASNLDSDFLPMTQQVPPSIRHLTRVESLKAAESTRRWHATQQQGELPFTSNNSSFQLPSLAGDPLLDELSQEDAHYSQTVSIILQVQASAPPCYLSYSPNSVFSRWNSSSKEHQLHPPVERISQLLLKYVLFTVPYLHSKHCDGSSNVNSLRSGPSAKDSTNMSRNRPGKGDRTPQEELSDNHVMAERRRREKLNERFITLRSLVPFVTKMDKASILGDTIEYLKQLCKKIEHLEARAKEMELKHTGNMEPTTSEERGQRNKSAGLVAESKLEKRKATETGDMLQVSIIESDALVELQCPHKEGLLLDVMLKLRDMRVEVTAVQSSLNNGFLVAELRAKVKENDIGKKASIVEVKKAVYQIVPHSGS